MRLSRLTPLLAVFACAVVAQGPAKAPSVVEFSGEATRGQSFSHDIGRGLIFRLRNSPGGPDLGWQIEIVPVPGAVPPDSYEEFSAIASPPYRSYNERYLETSYGTKAEEAVGITPREFQFVESVADSKVAYDVVDSVLSSRTFPQQSENTASAAAKIPVGTGELEILDSRITPGKDAKDMGTIDWVKFKVTLHLDSGQTLRDVLFPPPPAPQ
jgi:hypothetical protein